jgi:hypothetical protein
MRDAVVSCASMEQYDEGSRNLRLMRAPATSSTCEVNLRRSAALTGRLFVSASCDRCALAIELREAVRALAGKQGAVAGLPTREGELDEHCA